MRELKRSNLAECNFLCHLGLLCVFGFVYRVMDLKHSLKINKNIYIQVLYPKYEDIEKCFVNVMSTNGQFVFGFSGSIELSSRIVVQSIIYFGNY